MGVSEEEALERLKEVLGEEEAREVWGLLFGAPHSQMDLEGEA